MHKTLERLDASASTLVPLLYLAGLMLGAISYFAGITLNLGLAVGIALATAAELHSFLQQRRVRAAYARLQRLADTDTEYEIVIRQFRVNTWILVGLLVFSGINATAFAAETWTPVPGPLWWRWAQIVFRGLVIPAFFFAAGFLVPLHLDASDQLHATSSEMLRRTLKAIDRQWRMRLKRAEKRSADLAPVAIALLQESGDHAAAKRLALISKGLYTAEAGESADALLDSLTAPAPTPQPAPPLPRPSEDPLPAASAAASNARLSNHELRRAALARQMDTDLQEYDLPPEDEDDWARYAPPADDRAWDEKPLTRIGGHPTSPRNGHNGRASFSNHASANGGSSAAHIAPRYSAMSFDLPEGKTEKKTDTIEAKRVMRYLDRHPGATIPEVMKGAKVSKPTARRYYTSWIERNERTGATPAPFTQEIPIVMSEQSGSTVEVG